MSPTCPSVSSCQSSTAILNRTASVARPTRAAVSPQPRARGIAEPPPSPFWILPGAGALLASGELPVPRHRRAHIRWRWMTLPTPHQRITDDMWPATGCHARSATATRRRAYRSRRDDPFEGLCAPFGGSVQRVLHAFAANHTSSLSSPSRVFVAAAAVSTNFRHWRKAFP